MRNPKAQVAPEFLLGIGIIMMLFLLISIFVVNKQIDLKKRQDHIDKRNECLKIANLINSIYINGHGTEVKTHSNYFITTFNSSLISIEDITNKTDYEKIAIVVSESGPSKYEFYTKVNYQLDPDPDWFKACFDDISSIGCDSENATWIDQNIINTTQDLINNIDNYTTIYLENPNLQFSTNYITKLQTWVLEGNALIISRNIMCREQASGSYSSNSYQCNPDGDFNNDDWQVFNVTIHQRDDAWGYPYDWNVDVINMDESFNLFPGDKLSFKNRPYVISNNAIEFKNISIYRNDTCQSSPCLEDSSDKVAIGYWQDGEGKIFYIGDFDVVFTNPPDNDFSDTLINLISIANDLILRPEKDSDITCSIPSNTFYQRIKGDITIKNINNVIYLENVIN